MVWSQRKNPARLTHRDSLRQRILARDPLCRLHIIGVCTAISTEVDHIVALYRGGLHHPSNLQGVCHPCHAYKTAYEAAAAKPRAKRPAEPPPGAVPPGAVPPGAVPPRAAR